ncbi:MAG: hypoxanthine phosphoribosyltransferase [Bacteroidales bacterium]|nr:hypoxanthine phosphoribosyltransferase [Bacteroidales bacterium]
METIAIQDKIFKRSIAASEIQSMVTDIAARMNYDLEGDDVVFVAILNGAFMFASDLIRKIKVNCRITFLKLASYQGSNSTGIIKQLIGLNEVLKDKTVVIVEDIVDTGITLDTVLRQIESFQPKEIKVAALLFKPDVYTFSHRIDYVGFNIPNEFVVGYGLDYNGYGRNLEHIYTITD